MIALSHVSKQYGRQILFVDASFQLNPGERVGLVGPNGAGKTTLFRMMQLTKDFPLELPGVLRNLAGAFQFSGDDIDKKIRALSGGEKTRLVMARMLLEPPNFLVLDEPTNHLDLATKEMLVDSLESFAGTMVFVSHDRTFLRGLGTRVLELGGESGTDSHPHAYPGSYVEYVERTRHEAPGTYL